MPGRGGEVLVNVGPTVQAGDGRPVVEGISLGSGVSLTSGETISNGRRRRDSSSRR